MEFDNNKFPPLGASYQSAVSPLPTLTERFGIVAPEQIVLSPHEIGALTSEQLQVGELTFWIVAQFVLDVAVKTTFVPIGISITVFPEVVPAELITVALLEKLTE